MNTQELTSYLDELLFSKTGEHLDSLQLSIIRGVLNGKKYGSSLLGMVRQGGINRLNPYLARNLIDQFALDQK